MQGVPNKCVDISKFSAKVPPMAGIDQSNLKIRVRKSRVARQRTSQVLAEELRNMILSGELDGRSQLPPEPELAEQLAVSRHHLREALRLLEQDGHIKVRPGRNGGIFVTVPTVEVLTRTFAGILARNQTSLADLMAARVVLEPAAAALAARTATDDDIATLDRILRSQESEQDDICSTNSRFHVALTAAAHNQTLLVIMQAMEGLVRSLDVHANSSRDDSSGIDRQLLSGSIRAHQRILEAVKQRDAARAEELVRRHLLGFSQTLRERGADIDRQTVADLLLAEAGESPALLMR